MIHLAEPGITKDSDGNTVMYNKYGFAINTSMHIADYYWVKYHESVTYDCLNGDPLLWAMFTRYNLHSGGEIL